MKTTLKIALVFAFATIAFAYTGSTANAYYGYGQPSYSHQHRAPSYSYQHNQRSYQHNQRSYQQNHWQPRATYHAPQPPKTYRAKVIQVVQPKPTWTPPAQSRNYSYRTNYYSY